MAITDKQKIVTVVIAVDNHTHAGELCKKGDTIHVTEASKQFMLKHKIINTTGEK